MTQTSSRPATVGDDEESATQTPTTRDRVVLGCLLTATAVLYLGNIGASRFANDYYSAAAQAGSNSWTAFLFGSLDSGGAITVDKPPLALWPMDLAVHLFGLHPWAVLAPQALEGVGAVALLWAIVARATRSPAAAHLAAGLLALTPVAVVIFRFNNPDALLTLLLLGAAHATLRALDSPRSARWLVLAGVLVGLGFSTKMLEAFLVLPALVATYAVHATVPMTRRLVHLLAAGGAVAVAGGWWIVLVASWPAGSRPWIGGSRTNSALELAVGYNGVQRLTGANAVSDAGGSGLATTNVARVARLDLGGEIGWLLPAALVLGAVTWWLCRHDPRLRRTHAATTLWLLWLVVPGLTFAAMTGIFHTYYTVILAPGVAALAATGAVQLWGWRSRWGIRTVLASTSAITTVTAVAILAVVGAELRWLIVPVLVMGAGTVVALMSAGSLTPRTAAMAVTAAVLAPAAFSLTTATLPHVGSAPMAGPGHGAPTTAQAVIGGVVGGDPEHAVPSALVDILRTGHYRWSAAAVGARSASAYALASRTPVAAIGGYKGTDPTPTLRQFQLWVATGQVHLFLPGGTAGPASTIIQQWVVAHWSPTEVNGVTYYDLSR